MGGRLERLPEAVETEEEQREDARLWREMGGLFLTKSRLIGDQVRHEQRARHTLTVDQGGALVSSLADSVRRHVRDRQALAAIAREMEEIIEGISRVAG